MKDHATYQEAVKIVKQTFIDGGILVPDETLSKAETDVLNRAIRGGVVLVISLLFEKDLDLVADDFGFPRLEQDSTIIN